MKDQNCHKLPQKVLKATCFAVFRIKLDNFKDHISERRVSVTPTRRKREKKDIFFSSISTHFTTKISHAVMNNYII